MTAIPLRRLALTLPASLLLLAACSRTGEQGRVILRENGRVEAIGASAKASRAKIAAIDAADKYCRDKDGSPVFSSEAAATLRKEEAGTGLLSKIPVIGPILAGSEDHQVVIGFKCS